MKMKEINKKIKNALKSCNNEILIFLSLLSNFSLLMNKAYITGDILYPLHLVDLRAGFISRTLIGSISGLIWEHPTKGNISFMLICANILTYALVAFFLGKCIKNAGEKHKIPLLILSCFVAVFPYGFMNFINLFELLDIYWGMSAVLILICYQNNKTVFLIPVFIFTALWVHYSFLFAFMPLVYIICINKAILDKERRSYALLGIMITVSVGFTFYFMLTGRELKIPFDDFKNLLINKAGDNITQFEAYIGKTFTPLTVLNDRYHILPADIKGGTAFKLFAGNFIYTIRHVKIWYIISDILISSPIIVFFEKIFIKAMKKTEKKLNKLPLFLTVITPGITLLSLFISTDTSRWISKLIITFLFVLAIMLYEKNEAVEEAFAEGTEFIKKHRTPVMFLMCIYMIIIFVW